MPINKHVSVLGYCWGDALQAGYFKWHGPALRMVGVDTDVNHLALRFGNWIVHPFSDNKIKWVKDSVSDRCFGQPCRELYIGESLRNLGEAVNEGKRHETITWTCYAWFYTLGMYKNKRDCVSWVKNMLAFTNNIPKLPCQTPSCLLKELENHGYGILRSRGD